MPSIEQAVADAAPELIHAINVDFEDSMVFAVRVLGQRPTATAARVTGLSPAGVSVRVADADGESDLELRFDAEVTELAQLTSALFGLVIRAREASGEQGATSVERRMAEVASCRTFLTEVVDVEDVHPHLRRITFGGEDLAGLQLPGPDAFLYVLLPPPGRTELTIERSFTWEAYNDMPAEERPVGANYTVRRWDPASRRLTMLFVLHGGPEDGAGPASAWAAKAAVGDPAALWGPRTAFDPPAGTDRYLLVADETGLPAVAGILEWLPPEIPVHVVAEVADSTARQELPERPSVAVTWCHRDGAEAGTTSLLLDAVRGLPTPSPTTYVWGGGESRTFAAVRRHLRRERGLARDAVALVAYWRRGDADADPDADDG